MHTMDAVECDGCQTMGRCVRVDVEWIDGAGRHCRQAHWVCGKCNARLQGLAASKERVPRSA